MVANEEQRASRSEFSITNVRWKRWSLELMTELERGQELNDHSAVMI